MKKIVLVLTILLLTTGCAQAEVKATGTSPPQPKEKSETGDARAYAHYLMGLIHDNRGEFEEAAKEYREALRVDPRSPSIIAQLIKDYLRLGQGFNQQGKVEEAIKEYESILELYPGDLDRSIPIRFFMAAIYEEAGQPKEAEIQLEKVLELNPKTIEAYLELGQLRLKRGLLKEAIDILEKGRKVTLRESDLYFLPRPTPEGYRKEVRKNLYFLLGLGYGEKGNYREAASAYQECLKVDPHNETAHFYLGVNLERQGKVEEAILELKKTVELNPENADTLNYLGYLYAEKGVNLEESIGLLKRALEIKPESSYITDSLGWAYFKKGMLDEALRELKRAVALSIGKDKDDAIIRDHLGDAYMKKGMVKEAAQQWEKSLELDPENDKVREKLKRTRKSLP